MILSEEHSDCENWAHWVRDNDPRIGYPRKWSLPDGPGWHLDEDKHDRELDALEQAYDERRAEATDRLFRVWLDRYRRLHDFVAKRHFHVIRAAYLIRHDVGELTVREALRALADLKAECRLPEAPERPTLRAVA